MLAKGYIQPFLKLYLSIVLSAVYWEDFNSHCGRDHQGCTAQVPGWLYHQSRSVKALMRNLLRFHGLGWEKMMLPGCSQMTVTLENYWTKFSSENPELEGEAKTNKILSTGFHPKVLGYFCHSRHAESFQKGIRIEKNLIYHCQMWWWIYQYWAAALAPQIFLHPPQLLSHQKLWRPHRQVELRTSPKLIRKKIQWNYKSKIFELQDSSCFSKTIKWWIESRAVTEKVKLNSIIVILCNKLLLCRNLKT